jgi:hypothetical protein
MSKISFSILNTSNTSQRRQRGLGLDNLRVHPDDALDVADSFGVAPRLFKHSEALLHHRHDIIDGHHGQTGTSSQVSRPAAEKTVEEVVLRRAKTPPGGTMIEPSKFSTP